MTVDTSYWHKSVAFQFKRREHCTLSFSIRDKNFMYILIPNPMDRGAGEQAKRLDKELSEGGLSNQLPLWGKLWVRGGKIVAAIPLHPDELPPLLFIDETSDCERQIFSVGALLYSGFQAIATVLKHVKNLVNLSRLHKKFWSPNSSPPRLHLKDLNHPASRTKKQWNHVPSDRIAELLQTVVPSIRELATMRFVASVDLTKFENTWRAAFPELPSSSVQTQFEQMKIKMASMMLRIIVSESKIAAEQLEIIADHDSTRIQVGKGRRQATLHLLDSLAGGGLEDVPAKPRLVWDQAARYTSRFPPKFTLEKLCVDGFCLRTLIETIGLQFTDVLVGLSRILGTKPSYMGITGPELGPIHSCTSRSAHG